MFGDGKIVLRCLKIFRQIGIVIILAVKLAVLVNGAVRRQASLDGKFHHPGVHYRQNSRQTETDRTDMCILLRAKPGGTTAKDLGLRFQFAMDFQSDNSFVFHPSAPSNPAVSL